METLKKEYSKLSSAIITIRQDKEAAVERLTALNNEFPALLADVAIGNADPERLEILRGERAYLQNVIAENVEPSCTILHTRLKEFSMQMQRIRNSEQAISDEVFYRQKFNEVFESGSRKADVWAVLKGSASNPNHRKQVALLENLLSDYDFKCIQLADKSPAAFCAEHGLLPYDLNVTAEDLASPR